jgi:hypothetical protein
MVPILVLDSLINVLDNYKHMPYMTFACAIGL